MRSRKKSIFKTLAVFLILIFIVLNSKISPSALRINAASFLAPVLESLDNAASAIKKIIPFSNFREENKLLRHRVELLSRSLEEMKAVHDENERLKSLLDFRKAIPYTTVPAQVIGRDPSNWSNSLIIDKGTSQGIRQNKAVLSTRGLVGRTVEVGRRFSKILLINDANSKVGVMIRRNRQGGILVGSADGKCRMIYIALDSDVSKGDKVMTAGFGAIFPKGILAGEVVSVDKEPGRLYKYAIVEPSQDLSKLEDVLCIK